MKAKDGDKNMTAALTMGPVLFHWPAEKKRDFYYKIADEAPVDTVYLGEVVCSKRTPFFEHYYVDVAERLIGAGKKVVFCSLAEVMIPRERKMTEGLCELEDFEIEANDASALYHLRGKPHRIGQYFNVYNEASLEFLATKGATHFTLPAELPKQAINSLTTKAKTLNVALEIQVFGKVGLALSARCYHARAHNRIKDNCQFVCEEDPDGMALKTLNGQPFLSINGIQTLSNSYLNLIHEMKDLHEKGINHFRLSPHNIDMIKVAQTFQKVLDENLDESEINDLVRENITIDGHFADGFFNGEKGYTWSHAQ